MLLKEIKFLAKDSFVYGGANAVSKIFSIILFPLLARHLGPEEFGIYDYFMVLISYITVLFVFGQDSAIARFVFEFEKSADKSNIISLSLAIQLLGVIIAVPVAYVNVDKIVSLLKFQNSEVVFYIKLTLIQVPLLICMNFAQNLLKWTFQRNKFLILTLGYAALNSIILITSINSIDIKLRDVLIINFICNLIFTVIGIYYIKSWLVIPRRIIYIKQLMNYAVPFGVVCAVSGLMPTIERTLILNVLGPEHLSQYAVAYKIAMLLSLLIVSFQTAWGPFSLNYYKNENAQKLFNIILKLFTLIMSVVLLTMVAFQAIAIKIFAGSAFNNASTLIFPLGLGIAIVAISSIVEIGIDISKKTYLHLYSYIVEVIITTMGIFLFAKEYGIYAVVLSNLLGKITKSSISIYFSNKVYRSNWDIAKNLCLILYTFIAGTAINFISNNYGLVHAISALFPIAILILSIFYYIILSVEEKNELEKIIGEKVK